MAIGLIIEFSYVYEASDGAPVESLPDCRQSLQNTNANTGTIPKPSVSNEVNAFQRLILRTGVPAMRIK